MFSMDTDFEIAEFYIGDKNECMIFFSRCGCVKKGNSPVESSTSVLECGNLAARSSRRVLIRVPSPSVPMSRTGCEIRGNSDLRSVWCISDRRCVTVRIEFSPVTDSRKFQRV